LSAKAAAIAQLIDDLLTEFGYAYKLAVVELSQHWFPFGAARRLHLPITRALQMLSRRLALAHRVYAAAPSSLWLEMHELYMLARQHHVEKLGLGTPQESPLAAYRDALLLAFAEPHKLMQGELDHAMEFVGLCGDLAVFIDSIPEDPVDGLYVIQTERDTPGLAYSKRLPGQPTAGMLVLNTARIADRASELAELAQSLPATEIEQGENPGYTADLMRRLVKHWTATPNRQYSRLRRHARVDICVGLHGIWHFLRDQSDRSEPRTGNWMVTNESPGGFALMHVSGPVVPIKVGEAIGVKGQDSDRVHICVVRWVQSDSPEHVELGLEELAPNAKPISIARLPSGAAQASEPGLLLPEIPALKRAASILALPGRLDATSEFHFGEPQQRVRATHLLEQTLSIEVFQFSPISG
jgi:cyclic-di-GMP-binding protein